MKKIISIIIISAMLLSFLTFNTIANEEFTNDFEILSDVKLEKIEIIFSVGDSTLKVNGKELKVETPYVVDGTTLVPLRVITESFGAHVSWDGETKTVTISDNSVEIKLQIGNKTAYVNGLENELNIAPELVNSITMVPLRFITENFGAIVSYDEKSKEIKVLKELTESNTSIDYAMLLNRSDKQKLGDSFYKWSLKRENGLRLVSRSFDGMLNKFLYEDAYLTIQIYEREKDDNVDTYIELLKTFSKPFTTMFIGKTETKDKKPVAKLQIKSAEIYGDIRFIVSDDYTYSIFITTNATDKIKKFNELCKIADDFQGYFPANNTAEDLTNVDPKTKNRTFQVKDLALTLDLPADFKTVNSDKNIDNEFSFARRKVAGVDVYDTVKIAVYSETDEINYKSIAEYDYKYNSRIFNKKYATYTDLAEEEINGHKSISYTETINFHDKKSYKKDVFIDGGNYLYNICIETIKNPDKSFVDKIIKSINIGEVVKEKVGSFMRINSSEDIYKLKLYEYNGGVSFMAPEKNWTSTFDQGIQIAYSKNSGTKISVIALTGSQGIIKGKTKPFYYIATSAFQYMQQNDKKIDISEHLERIPDLHNDAYTFYIIEKDEKTYIRHVFYYIETVDKSVYEIEFVSLELYSGDNFYDMIENVLNSLILPK